MSSSKNFKKLTNQELKRKRIKLFKRLEKLDQEIVLENNKAPFMCNSLGECHVETYRDTLIETVNVLIEIIRRDNWIFEMKE